MPEALLTVDAVTKQFSVRTGILKRAVGAIGAVDRVSLALQTGETLGLVGESGCGKTTLAKLIVRLLEPTGGRIIFEGRELTALRGRDLRQVRRRIQMVFQDPHSSLNPRFTVAQTLDEPLQLRGLSRRDRRQMTLRLLERVGLSAAHVERRPMALSGGERQRVGLARALALEPRLIVCDEPIAALDVSVGSQILALLASLQEELGMSYLFISHDLMAVATLSHRIAVMYMGRIVELAATQTLFQSPLHPYTELLLASVGTLPARGGAAGEIPSLLHPPSGCRFRTRCPLAERRCEVEEPALLEKRPGRFVACHKRP